MITSTISLVLAALPVAFAATYNIQVGPGGRLIYEPESLAAAPGDTINFIFNPKNHTVTQSTFDAPCTPQEGGARTGFVPVPPGTALSALPIRQFVVPPGNAPLWFYCGQTGHCGQGMVFAINAPPEGNARSFSAFKALAIGGGAPPASPSTPPPATTDAFTTPPAPSWTSATATVTWQGQVYTTTYKSYDGTPPPTPAPNPVDHKIIVGEGGVLNYNPPNIQANINDTVTFEFRPKNHTVTQSSFLNPCTGFVDDDGTAGFKSGFRPVSADQTADFPTFQIKINDTRPIWGYCGQTNHCVQGMVFAINAVESGPNNFAAFVELAKRSAASPSGGASPSGSPTTTDDPPAPSGGASFGSSVSHALVVAMGLVGFAVLTL